MFPQEAWSKLLASSLCGPWRLSSTPAPPTPSSCSPPVQQREKRKKKRKTRALLDEVDSPIYISETFKVTTIAMMGVKRASLTWYLCHWETMDAVLKNKCACNVHDHLVALKHLSQPAFTPRHHYGAALLRAPALTFTQTNRSFCACDCFTLVSVIKISIILFLEEC